MEINPMYEDLVKKINVHHRRGTMNRVVGDWFGAISIIIVVAIPSLLLLKQHFALDTQNTFDSVIIGSSLVSMVLSVINSIYRFKERSNLNFQIKTLLEDGKKMYDGKIIGDSELVDFLRKVAQKELYEIRY
jgi:hypothetical protein